MELQYIAYKNVYNNIRKQQISYLLSKQNEIMLENKQEFDFWNSFTAINT